MCLFEQVPVFDWSRGGIERAVRHDPWFWSDDLGGECGRGQHGVQVFVDEPWHHDPLGEHFVYDVFWPDACSHIAHRTHRDDASVANRHRFGPWDCIFHRDHRSSRIDHRLVRVWRWVVGHRGVV